MVEPYPAATALFDVRFKCRHGFGWPAVGRKIELEHDSIVREQGGSDGCHVGNEIDGKSVCLATRDEPGPGSPRESDVMAPILSDGEHFERGSVNLGQARNGLSQCSGQEQAS